MIARLDAKWAAVWEEVFAPHVPPADHARLRLAFYAGALAATAEGLARGALPPPAEFEALGLRWIEDLRRLEAGIQ